LRQGRIDSKYIGHYEFRRVKQFGVYQPTRQAKRGEFRAGLAHRKSADCELFSDRYSTSLSLYLKSPQGEVGIVLPRSPSNHFIINGINLGDDQLAVAQLGEGMNISGPGPIGSDVIVMSKPRFIELLEVLCPTSRAPKRLTLVKVFAPERSALGDLIVNLIGAPDVDLQGERITNLLAWAVSLIGHASDQYRPENIKGLKAHSRIAKGARDYIEMNFQEPVHIEELCKHTGVGVRRGRCSDNAAMFQGVFRSLHHGLSQDCSPGCDLPGIDCR
jgi:hypothetical protein